ncbi:MAG: hypothetical protein ACYTFW_26685 [Planctomycetota bacterium]|jgi:hypothetical protein
MAKSSLKVTLPGSIYKKNGRWWWKVKLPAQTRTKARALKPAGARFAATDRKVAEEVAREMWRLAIEAETEARIKVQVKAKANKEIANAKAKAKAECAKKIKACEQALAKAREQAKAQAEERAKTEAELKDRAKQTEKYYAEEITKIRDTIEKARVEFEEKDKAYNEALAGAEEKAKAEAEARKEAEARAEAEAKLRLEAEQRASAEAEARAQDEAKLNEVLGDLVMTGTCECCGRKDVSENDLVTIDSGQSLCPDCLEMLRG